MPKKKKKNKKRRNPNAMSPPVQKQGGRPEYTAEFHETSLDKYETGYLHPLAQVSGPSETAAAKRIAAYLQETGAYPTREQILAGNIVDLTGYAGKSSPMDASFDPDRISFESGDGGYATPAEAIAPFLPCFTDGAFRTNVHRYLGWHVDEIADDAGSARVSIRDYTQHKSIWVMNAELTIRIRALPEQDDAGEIEYVADIKPVPSSIKEWRKTCCTAGTARMARELKKTDPKAGSAVERMLRIIGQTEDLLREKHGYYPAEFAMLLFGKCQMLLNQALLEHEPTPVRTDADGDPDHGHIHGVPVPDGPKPARAMRDVGPHVRIVSDGPPIRHVREIQRKYVTPSWQTRGHMRTYKSGKTVYVRPSVHVRKCLKDVAGDADPAPATITVRA